MTRRRAPWPRLAAVAVGSLLIGGCAGTGPVPEPETLRGEVHAVELGALDGGDIARAQTLFGLDLLHALCARSPAENVVVSPTSAAVALGMLYPAASGATAADLGAMLHLPAWSPDVVAAVREHTQSLAGLAPDGDPGADGGPDFVTLSNRIWPRTGLVPDQAYLDDVATAFDAGVHPLDFVADPDGATEVINEAVGADTDGIIDELFTEPLARSTVVVLTNAVHLKARWASPFTDTRDAPFHAADGTTTVPMMFGGAATVQDAEGWQSVRLDYRDGTLTARAVLPPQGVDPCEIAVDHLDGLDAAPADGADVALPRMRFEQDHDLLDTLASLGLRADGDYPAFGGMYIDRVVQSTFLEVDEDGTEAAAATGVVGDESASASPTVVLDRPFLLVLSDTATGSPLFFAVVQDP